MNRERVESALETRYAVYFSDILAGREPASFVYRDDLVVAFLDISPITPGHTLIVPVCEVRSFADLTEDVSGRKMRVAGDVARAIPKAVLHCEGVNLLLSDGEVAGQEVPHAHLHVIPRYPNDGFTFSVARVSASPTREELHAIALCIKSRMMEALRFDRSAT